MLTRRSLLQLAAVPAALATDRALDRRAMVSRHNPVFRAMDARAPLSVGNGEFAFTVDVTGLQSLSREYENTTPLCTQSQWGWHSSPPPGDLTASDLRLETFDAHGRKVGYATSARGQEPLFNWLRENPHRLNLGRIGLQLDGRALELAEITAIEHRLDLWNGRIESRFRLQGSPVNVTTYCHPDRDSIAVSVESPLLAEARLVVLFEFPYGSPAMNAADWTQPAKHSTTVETRGNSAEIHRRLDGTTYYARLFPIDAARIESQAEHEITLASPRRIDLTCEFSAVPFNDAPHGPVETRKMSELHWNGFWSRGGAIDLSGSSDSRAQELERRMVLSQYLTAIQCAGSKPPQETGLTCNSWYGKFHLEMHWWHAAHFALWGRAPMLERSLAWYNKILPSARDKAKLQGYSGARWPKMTAPDGRSSPSNIGELLIWQQPHPIAMAELCYRANPRRELLTRYADVVMDSAEFMASFAALENGRYVLGPPVIPAQENHPPRDTWNPTFELEYWREGLGIAQKWRERLGKARNAQWENVRAKLSALPVKDGVYLAHENCPRTFTERNRDHPSMLAALGVLAGERVDRETMRRTLHKVMREWRWDETWGWDFPMVAMTAARLGEPGMAVDALFIESPKNTWLANGHNWQRANLPLYLPGNGGLLAAVAMMAAKWDGFPKKGWRVRHEGLSALL